MNGVSLSVGQLMDELVGRCTWSNHVYSSNQSRILVKSSIIDDRLFGDQDKKIQKTNVTSAKLR